MGGVLFYFGGTKMDSNLSKCGADEHRRRRLDGADPLFSPKAKMHIESYIVHYKFYISTILSD